MASVPLSQPVDLVRFNVHYPLSSESNDRGPPTHSHTPQARRPSPNSSNPASPAASGSPVSNPPSAPSHHTSFGLDAGTNNHSSVTTSEPGIASDTGWGQSVAHSSPSVLTWQEGPVKRDVHFGDPFPYATPGPHQPQYRPDLPAASYPRTAPYYMPMAPMNPVDMGGQRDMRDMYDQRAHEDQLRRDREITKSRRHVCPVCHKRFNRPSSLTTHMSVHTGAKPYQCTREGCGRRFSVSSNLRRHERTHEARARPAAKQQPTLPRAAPASYQPTMYVQAPPPPPNISYPYTYHTSHASNASASHSMGSQGLSTSSHRHPYSMSTSATPHVNLSQPSTRDYQHPSLVHRDQAHSGGGGGPNGGGHSQPVTPPAQQSILMPQPTKSNSLMLG